MSKQVSWHSLTTEEVVAQFKSNMTRGLSHDEARERLKRYGTNSLPEPKRRSLSSIFLHQFLSPLIYLLLAASGIAFFIGEARDAIVIFVVVLLNAIIGTLQEGRAEQSLEALRRLSKLKARVLRNGEDLLIEASELVPGDILILGAGDAVPADARLIDASSVAAAEASLTGESVPGQKSIATVNEETALADRHNMIYASTHITSGRGIAIVVTTGISSEIGKIATLATTTIQPKTQLEIRIQQFGRYIVVAALIVFSLVIGLGLLREIPFAQIFMIAISQMVALIPEGLPVAMTIALAVGVRRMARRGTIVRRLAAVESLGSTTVICSDKTGTLTRNEMTVTSVYLPAGNREISIQGVGYIPEGHFVEAGNKLIGNSDATLKKLSEACCLCNDAQLLGPDASDSRWRVLGDPTEGALITFAAKGGVDPSSIRKEFPRKAELPFNSDVKMMATQHEIDGKNVIFIKGAPESILDFCNSIYHDGHIKPFDSSLRIQTQNAANKMADSALRVLALGFITDASIDESKGFSPFAGKVTLVGLIGELDPPRNEVAASVRDCQTAGIRPVMVTGDHKATAVAIAKALGIARKNDLAIDGKELEQLSDKELLEKLDRISVFARVHPAQKLRIVEAYQTKGEIVAMTGDGVNDAPALVRANVGIAMGITGTEVAKEAAKIVVMDDNFATIVIAISEGRLVYQNLKKVILYLFSTSIAEVLILFAALLAGFPPPLAAVQILWINLVTEGLVTVNLIMEPHEGNEMKRPPISQSQPLLSQDIVKRMLFLTPLIALVTFGWYAYRTAREINPAVVQTETFMLLAICQWFNILNVRSSEKSAFEMSIFKNGWLIGGIAVGNILQILVIFWRPLGDLFHTVAINLSQVFVLGAVGSIVLFGEELRKFILRKLKNRNRSRTSLLLLNPKNK